MLVPRLVVQTGVWATVWPSSEGLTASLGESRLQCLAPEVSFVGGLVLRSTLVVAHA